MEINSEVIIDDEEIKELNENDFGDKINNSLEYLNKLFFNFYNYFIELYSSLEDFYKYIMETECHCNYRDYEYDHQHDDEYDYFKKH
jgi:hypothetical protein